ncbi:transcriptional regulator [Bacillus sp. V3-13]|uniref:PRD domain-containing protein n=1 Tax=Bacillus sp. V3-13 TaxID=2053728 RepID=UPI000C78585F|nr:PRD domain-containing protein [Bacillus sp. V3-13]PLR75961.1 transcriptional regulator [Bacillus sp. V3-13]
MELRTQELYEKSEEPKLCKEVMQFTEQLMLQKNIKMTESQLLSLLSHISGMVYRSKHRESIEQVDPLLFKDVSDDSIDLAKQVCEIFSDLDESEKYLLSIHFEAAKVNN